MMQKRESFFKQNTAEKLKNKSVLVYLLGLTVFIIVNLFLLILIQGERKNNILFMQYTAEKRVSYLLESLQENTLDEALSVYKDITGFGLYQTNGDRLIAYGTAPNRMSKEMMRNTYESFQYNRQKKSIILIRAVGPMGHIRNQMTDMPMMRRFSRMIYLEILQKSFFFRNRLYLMTVVIFPLLFLAVIMGFIFLFQKNQLYKKKLQEQLELSKLGEISRTLSHEIKNPLSAIRIQTGLLKKILPESYQNEITVIDEEVDRLKNLTERIGDFIRDPVGQPEKLDIVAFINELIKYRQPGIIFKKTDGSPEYIQIDPLRFHSILENLILNAEESMIQSGIKEKPVEIETEETDQQVNIRIMDCGTGLPDGDIAKLFDPYYTTKTKGSGIGLAVVKRFVEAAGGSISLIPRPGGGTVAVLIFKRVEV